MLHKTKAIILRQVAYGDTSLIVTAYTELFGLQAYLVKGARKVSKKGGGQVGYYQPAAMLELVVYHNELKNLQIISEVKWAYIYDHIFSRVLQNSVALFMVELLTKCIREPETNAGLFAFAEQNLVLLDEADPAVVANLPLHFFLHLAGELGFQMNRDFSEANPILDLKEGVFTSEFPAHGLYLDGILSETTYQLLQMDNPIISYRLKLNQTVRRQLLKAYEQFYLFHLPEFGYLKSLPVLETVLGA